MPAQSPERTARTLLLAATAGLSYQSYFSTRAYGPDAWNAVLTGHAAAPEQYRIGAVWVAHWLALPLHCTMPLALTLLSGVSALVALLALFQLFLRTAIYREATLPECWFGLSAFVLLALWFLAWALWIPKPETFPAAALLALLLRLTQRLTQRPTNALRAALMLALTLALATLRADIACLFNLGLFLTLLRDLLRNKPAPRRWLALTTSLASALAAGALQLWIIRIAYPQATYGPVKLWQLGPNLHHASRWPPFVVFMLPLFWLATQLRHRAASSPLDTTSRATLLAAALYLCLWITIGKLDEVRIFLPFALALTPLAAATAMQRASD